MHVRLWDFGTLKSHSLNTNFYTSGMACRTMDKRKGGTKVQRTEAWFFAKKIQAIKKKIQVVKKMDKEKPLGEWDVSPSGYKRDNIPDKKRRLFHFLTLKGIYLPPAEDEDLTVMNNLCTLYIVPLYIFDALCFAFTCRGKATGIGGNRLVIGIFGS